jgi:hypothetical protein
MTLPWLNTGPTDAANADPHNWPRPGNAPFAPSTDDARCARNPCYMLLTASLREDERVTVS